MTGVTVKTTAGPPSIGLIKRGTGRLSNGDFVLLYVDSNPSGFGDGSGIRKMYLYHASAANPNTWTLKNTITPTSALGTFSYVSMAVDSADNIHIGFIPADGTVRYYLLTFVAGPTWTASAQISVNTGTTTHRALDIDVLTGTVAVIGTQVFATSASNIFRSYIRRSSDNTWIQLTDQTINTTNAQTTNLTIPYLSIARDTTAAVANEMYFVYIIGEYGASDPGDDLRYKKVNVSTGAQVSDTSIYSTILSGQGSVVRNYMIFSRGDNKFILGALYGSVVTIYYFNRTNILSFVTATKSRYGATSPFMGSFLSTEKSLGVIVQTRKFNDFNLYTYYTSAHVFKLDDVTNGITDLNAEYRFVGAFNNSAVCMYGGANRNNLTSTRKATVVTHYGGSDNYVQFGYNDAPLVPSVTSPAGSSTTNDVTPYLEATGLMEGTKPEWDLARDSGFTQSLRTISDDTYNMGEIYPNIYVPNGSSLFTGTWYIRAHAVDPFELAGSYGATNSFSVSYPPSTSGQSPTGDQYNDWGGAGNVSFSWTYSSAALEAGDAQTAYEIIIERNSDGLQIADTGKVIGTATTAVVNISATYKDVQLRWKIRVWNVDDAVGSYSSYQLFYVGDKPTVAITAPSNGGTVNNPQPNFAWTFTAGGTRVQQAFRVLVTQAGVTIHDSGWVSSASTSYQPSSPILVNATSYSVAVSVRGTGGLENTSTNTFTTAWTPPSAPTGLVASTVNYDDLGYITLTWNDAAIRDAAFVEYRIYKRLTGSGTLWTLVGTVAGASSTTKTFTYYMAQSNTQYDYVVAQAANVFSSIVESSYSIVVVDPGGTRYWLVDEEIPTQSILLYNVTDETFSEEYESSTLNLIGKGRKVDVGTRYGYVGSLSAQIRTKTAKTARQQRQELEALKTRRKAVYLRNPFGDLFLVWLNDISVARIAGVSVLEFIDVSIPYLEVAD